MNIPMKEKYVDEAVGVFNVLGASTEDRDRVFVNDGNRDVFCAIPKPAAEQVVKAQACFRAALYNILCGAPRVGERGDPAVTFNTTAHQWKLKPGDEVEMRPGVTASVVLRVYDADNGEPMYLMQYAGGLQRTWLAKVAEQE